MNIKKPEVGPQIQRTNQWGERGGEEHEKGKGLTVINCYV